MSISVKIAIAGLALSLSFDTAFSELISGATAPSNTAGLDERECQAIWFGAAVGEDRLSYEEAAPYIADLDDADPDNDGFLDKTEFLDACLKGLVQNESKDASIHIMLPPRPREQN